MVHGTFNGIRTLLRLNSEKYCNYQINECQMFLTTAGNQKCMFHSVSHSFSVSYFFTVSHFHGVSNCLTVLFTCQTSHVIGMSNAYVDPWAC